MEEVRRSVSRARRRGVPPASPSLTGDAWCSPAIRGLLVRSLDGGVWQTCRIRITPTVPSTAPSRFARSVFRPVPVGDQFTSVCLFHFHLLATRGAAAAALLKPHSLSIAHYLGPPGPTRIATGPMETAEQQARHDSSLARLIGQVPVVPSATASAPPP